MAKKKLKKTSRVVAAPPQWKDTNAYVEVQMDHATIDRVTSKGSWDKDFLDKEIDAADRQARFDKMKLLSKTVFKMASRLLTKKQFRIFVAKHLFDLTEMDIAAQFNVSQPYVAMVLSTSVAKIKAALDEEDVVYL